MNSLGLSPVLIATMAAAAILAIVLPLIAGWVARRKLEVTWRHFAIGALTFAVFQLFTRVPAVAVLQTLLQEQLAASSVLQWSWLAALSLTAGLFEEGGRYVAFRWLMKDEEKNWDKAVMVGLGHGGIESIVLVGFSVAATLVALVVMTPEVIDALPPEAMSQLDQVRDQNPLTPLAGTFERIMSMTLHVALSITVAQVFIRGGLKWLVGAVVAHALANFVVVSAMQVAGKSMEAFHAVLIAEGLMLVVGILSLLWIVKFRNDEQAGQFA